MVPIRRSLSLRDPRNKPGQALCLFYIKDFKDLRLRETFPVIERDIFPGKPVMTGNEQPAFVLSVGDKAGTMAAGTLQVARRDTAGSAKSSQSLS